MNVKLIKRIVSLGIVGIFALIIMFGGFYTLDTEHAAVVKTFGNVKTVSEPGWHFKVPLFQHVKKVNTTIQGVSVGYDETTESSVESESMMITSDYNFINIDFYVEYYVSDPVKYLYTSKEPIVILKNVTQNVTRSVIASYDVDVVLTTGKNEIQTNIKNMLMEKMESLDIGIVVKNITIQDAEPPTAEVSEAFKQVETSKQNKETALNNANKYRNEQIPAAQANADQIVQNADATKANRIAEAEGQVARFNSMYAEYLKFPLITKERMFYETMEEVLPNMKIVMVNSNGGTDTVLPLDTFADMNTDADKTTKEETEGGN